MSSPNNAESLPKPMLSVEEKQRTKRTPQKMLSITTVVNQTPTLAIIILAIIAPIMIPTSEWTKN